MRYFGCAIAIVLITATLPSRAQDDGCTNPNNPAWRIMHQSEVYRQICADEAQRALRAATLQQQWQQQKDARIQAQAQVFADQKTATAKAVIHGYELIPSAIDLILDGRKLAEKNAKVQIIGIYRKENDSEKLYASGPDAYNGTDKFISVLTDDAQRPLREHLLDYNCNSTGCEIAVGGHMQMCHYLNAALTNYPPMPCLHVEVAIQ